MRDRCKILDVSRAASTTQAEAAAAAEQTSLPCHKCRNCLHISLVIASAWRRWRRRGEHPPLLCTSAALHTHTHTRMYIFAFFVLLGSFGKRYKHSPTYTHSHTDNDVVAQPARASAAERERVSRRDNVVVVVVVGRGPSVERVQNDEVRLKYVSKPNNCRYCHYFWPTFKWKRERADDVSASAAAAAAATAKSTLALLANMFSFNEYSL